jgi:chromosome segregation ATPase
MSRELLVRVGRRVLVLAATLAVVGIAIGTIQVAAEWRAAAAPLDTAPAGMSTIADDYAAETERSQDLTARMDGVARQISELQVALIAANGSIEGDVDTATGLQAELDAAKAKLTAIQKQLKAAQGRLEQLNRAAARQAALNRAAATQARSGGGGGGGGEDHDDDDDDEKEHDDD